MPFLTEILKNKSVSIVGLEKNTGKTECLNYIIRQLKSSKQTIAITSIGLDGEGIDQLTNTAKPEIILYPGNIFVTAEKLYRRRNIDSEILNISTRSTALGRLVTAKALSIGKIQCSGPSDTYWMKNIISQMDQYQVNTTLVDGALSRLSPASPAITDAMILTTGAAVSSNMNTLIRKTKFVYDMIGIPAVDLKHDKHLLNLDSGLYSIDNTNNIIDLQIPSVFLIEKYKDKIPNEGKYLYISGAVTDKMLNFLKLQPNLKNYTLLIRDFTRMFVKPEVYRSFIEQGGNIRTLISTKILAVCANPVAPSGFQFNSTELCKALSETLGIKVYDIRNIAK